MTNGTDGATISVIVPTYKREQVLIETLDLLVPLLQPSDEIVVIDQTPVHEPATEAGLCRLATAGMIRWYRRDRPSQNEAMNTAARLARGAIVLFLDDDVIPSPRLLEAHREVLTTDPAPPATCGQVLQPWESAPVGRVTDFDLGFHAAYDKRCDIRSLMAGNFAMRRETYFRVGGMDENFTGSNYRNDAEMGYRICHRTGAWIRFVPEASLRHLHAGGGNRAFGAKDTWGAIGNSVGDYYSALRCLPLGKCVRHTITRFVRASLNRNTVRHPWLIPLLFVREVVAWCRAVGRVWTKPNNYIKDAAAYLVTSPIDAAPV